MALAYRRQPVLVLDCSSLGILSQAKGFYRSGWPLSTAAVPLCHKVTFLAFSHASPGVWYKLVFPPFRDLLCIMNSHFCLCTLYLHVVVGLFRSVLFDGFLLSPSMTATDFPRCLCHTVSLHRLRAGALALGLFDTLIDRSLHTRSLMRSCKSICFGVYF